MCPRQASRNYPTYPISDVCRGSDIDEVPPKPEQGQAVGEPPSGAEGKAAGLHLQGCPRGREDSCKGLEVFAEALLESRVRSFDLPYQQAFAKTFNLHQLACTHGLLHHMYGTFPTSDDLKAWSPSFEPVHMSLSQGCRADGLSGW